MRHLLRSHPGTGCEAVASIEAEVVRKRSNLILRYVLSGNLAGLAIPPAGAPARSDELWLHTCFEAFLRVPGAAGYYELNFSPSRQWAVYAFSGYRSGMTGADMPSPQIEVRSDNGRLELEVALDLPFMPADRSWSLGLSAIIEDRAHERSFWALAHPPGEPDFHDPACFALEVPPAGAP